MVELAELLFRKLVQSKVEDNEAIVLLAVACHSLEFAELDIAGS
jgi:hypothetical protein